MALVRVVFTQAPSSSSPNTTSGADAEQPPSPTPSDIVLAAHLDDTMVLGEEHTRMIEAGVESGRRKKVLREMESERDRIREQVRKRKAHDEERKEYAEEQEIVRRYDEEKRNKDK
jgi:hypothetical protein